MKNKIENLNELIEVLNLLVPEGTNEKLDINGIEVTLSNRNGEIKMEFTNDVKKYIKEFKSNIEKLDDSLFVDVVEELRNKIDIRIFDKLLKIDNFSSEEVDKIVEMIDTTSDVICEKLQEKINELEDLYDKFSR